MKSSDERRFSGERLYKLAKRAVVIISLLAGIWSIYALYTIQTGSIWKQWKSYCSEDYQPKSRDYNDCMTTASFLEENLNKNLEKTLPVALLLPTIFFGGTWLYKYLFPKMDSSKVEKIRK